LCEADLASTLRLDLQDSILMIDNALCNIINASLYGT